MAELAKVRDSRIFLQLEELVPYDLVGCSGITDWDMPRGAITPIREQSLTVIGEEDVVDFSRASKGMASFTFRTRLRDIANFMFRLKCESNWQCLFKGCGDPDTYYGYTYGITWQRCPPGDGTGEALKVIEGDNVPIHMTNPFSAIYGPTLVDFAIRFLSARTINEIGTIQDIVMFEEECLEDCQFAARDGQYGYAVSTAQMGSPGDDANVWWTDDDGDLWNLTSEFPFLAQEDISCVVKKGTVNNHRVIVSRGEAAAGVAEVAYADCTAVGQTPWVTANVGAVAGQYINYMSWPVYSKLFAVTNDGYIYKSVDGGINWTIVHQDAGVANLSDVSFNRNGIGWVTGDGDLLLRTMDWGNTWDEVTGPNDGALNLTTCCVDIGNKLIVGDSAGAIYGTVNDGYAWVATPPQGITATNIQRIRGHSVHWKWAIADIAAIAPYNGNSRVVRSTDGGATFRLWNLTPNIVPNNGLVALCTVDANRVLVGGAPYPVPGFALLSRTETNLDRIVS